MRLPDPTHRYRQEIESYLRGQSYLSAPAPWSQQGGKDRRRVDNRGRSRGGDEVEDGSAAKRFARFRHVQLPGDPSNMPGWDDGIERDTVKLCENNLFRRCLLGMPIQGTNVVIGRDIEPQCGMAVRLTEQGRERRRIASKAPNGPTAQSWAARRNERGAGENGTGEIVRVNGNWTVDVTWLSDGSTHRGYAVGGQGGRNDRAFHLELVQRVVPQEPIILDDVRVKNMSRVRGARIKGKGVASMFEPCACKVII